MAADDGDVDRANATEVWTALYDYCRARYAHQLLAVAELGLTPGDLKALMWLTPDEPQSMRALAEHWGSDASTVTWVVDRLEERGLVRRQPHATDRRIRVVALTEAGTRLRAEQLARLREPPAAFVDLSPAELRALRKVTSRLSR
jgi:DNA-binding MarR family transcriptional regulator